MPVTVTTTSPRSRGPAGALRAAFAALLVGLAVTACGPSDPLEAKVQARDYVTFSMWRSGAAGRLTPPQQADLDEAVQQIRFHVMASGAASGSAAVEEATLRMIDGRSVRHVLRQGLAWELERASAEKAALEDSMRQNALMRTRPGDTASAAYLADLADRQAARLGAANGQVDHARERLAAAGGPLGPAQAEPQGDAPRAPAASDAAPADAPPARVR